MSTPVRKIQGELGAPAIDLTGERFGKLVAVSRAPNVIYGASSKTAWRCVCDCGGKVTVETGSLRRGKTTKCWTCRANELREWHIGRHIGKLVRDILAKIS